MTRAIRTILLLSSFFLVVSFAVFVINQTAQLVALADRTFIHWLVTWRSGASSYST